MTDPRHFWDGVYARPGEAYGLLPNDFLVEVAPLLEGPVLCLGEGEGRNATFLAARGLEVTALDFSAVVLAHAQRLAQARGVRLTTCLADLADVDLGEARWGAIVSLWCHVPPWLAPGLHARITRALRPGARLVFEAYTPRQLAFDTGGPREARLLVEPEALRRWLGGLEVERLLERERDVCEGTFHTGRSAVVQCVARAPA
jgi:SAM-dependent methyltransferase